MLGRDQDMATVMGMNLSNKFMSKPIPLADALTAIRSMGIGSVKLFDWDKVDRDFAKSVSESKSPVDVALGIPNHRLMELSTLEGAKNVVGAMLSACQWGQVTMLPNVRWICVGNEPLLSGYNDQYLGVLSRAVNNVYNALQANSKKIGVTVPQNFDFMDNSWPPSAGKVKDKYKQAIKDTCSVMKKSGAPFMVNIYPFLTRNSNPTHIPLDYANFTKKTFQFRDPPTSPGGLGYYNLFDAMLDALHFALKDIEYGDLEIVIGESGWPTAGHSEATQTNAETFLKNLIAHCKSGKGTPRRPNKTIQCFAFEMYDEDKKSGPAFEHYWGVYDGQGKTKFPVIKW
jgi:Glycosyl hydrolases family 17